MAQGSETRIVTMCQCLGLAGGSKWSPQRAADFEVLAKRFETISGGLFMNKKPESESANTPVDHEGENPYTRLNLAPKLSRAYLC